MESMFIHWIHHQRYRCVFRSILYSTIASMVLATMDATIWLASFRRSDDFAHISYTQWTISVRYRIFATLPHHLCGNIHMYRSKLVPQMLCTPVKLESMTMNIFCLLWIHLKKGKFMKKNTIIYIYSIMKDTFNTTTSSKSSCFFSRQPNSMYDWMTSSMALALIISPLRLRSNISRAAFDIFLFNELNKCSHQMCSAISLTDSNSASFLCLWSFK